MKNKRSNGNSRWRINDRRPRTPLHHPDLVLPPFNAPIAQVLTEIKHEKIIKWPKKIKTDPRKGNKKKYFNFTEIMGTTLKIVFS